MFIKTEDTKCSKCRFFDRHNSLSNVLLGFCKRYPPVPIRNGEDIYPKVHEDNWCGEFKKLYKFDTEDIITPDGYKE